MICIRRSHRSALCSDIGHRSTSAKRPQPQPQPQRSASASAMGRPKISFAVGSKRKTSFDEQPACSESDSSTSSKAESTPHSKHDPVSTSQSSINDKLPGHSLEGSFKPLPSAGVPSNNLRADHESSSPSLPQQSKILKASKSTKKGHKMAEPPAKRAKRTDSSAMWDRNSKRSTDSEHKPRSTNEAGGVREKRGDRERPDEKERRDERDRHHGRDDRRHRSRSRDRTEKRRERSRSRERERDRDRAGRSKRSRSRDRDGGKHKSGERGEDRDKRDRRRSTSRERHRSRRGLYILCHSIHQSHR